MEFERRIFYKTQWGQEIWISRTEAEDLAWKLLNEKLDKDYQHFIPEEKQQALDNAYYIVSLCIFEYGQSDPEHFDYLAETFLRTRTSGFELDSYFRRLRKERNLPLLKLRFAVKCDE